MNRIQLKNNTRRHRDKRDALLPEMPQKTLSRLITQVKPLRFQQTQARKTILIALMKENLTNLIRGLSLKMYTRRTNGEGWRPPYSDVSCKWPRTNYIFSHKLIQIPGIYGAYLKKTGIVLQISIVFLFWVSLFYISQMITGISHLRQPVTIKRMTKLHPVPIFVEAQL